MRIEEKGPYDPSTVDTTCVRLPRSIILDCREIDARLSHLGLSRPIWRVISDAVAEAAPVYRDECPEIPRPASIGEPRQTVIRLPREAHAAAKVIAAQASRRQGRHVAMWHVLADAVGRLLRRIEGEGIGELR